MSVTIANTDAQLSGKTLLTADANQTITGLKTYDRGVSAPLAIVSGAAKVTNLDADKLDGEEGTAFHDASLLTGTVAAISGGTGLSSYAIGDLLYASGTTTLAKLADVATGQVLVSGGVATAPAYSASPSLGGTLGVTGLITSTGGITGGASSHTTGAFSSTVTGGTYNSQTISSAANFTGTLAVAGLTTLSATGDHWNKGSLSLGPAQSASIGAGDLSVARSATTAYLNFGSNGTVNLALASSVLTLNGATLTVSGFGTHSFSAGGTGPNALHVVNTTSGTANYGVFKTTGGTTDGYLYAFSQGYTTSGPYMASATTLQSTGSAGLNLLASDASGAIRFYSGGTSLRGGFESTNGNFHIGPTASTQYALYIEKAIANTYLAVLYNTSATTPHGIYMTYTAVAPNSTSCEFFRGDDTVGNKFAVRSNGGIANYSANNVNLSDATTKYISDVSPTSERELFRQLPLVLAKYLTSDRPVELMLTAQDVERVYPDLVEWFDESRQLKGIREYGLLMRSIKVIQELDAQLVSMEARLIAAGV